MMLVDPLQKRLDALLESVDDAAMHEVLDIQRRILAHVLAHYPRTVILFERCFSLLVEIVSGLNYADKSHWPKHRGTQLVLFAHNLSSLESAHDRLVKGCYEDTFALLRIPYEAFLRMVFMSMFPADAMSGIHNVPGQRAFQATNLLNQDLILTWTDHRLLSLSTHAHQFSALRQILNIAHGSREPVALVYRFDAGDFTRGVNTLSLVLYLFLGMAVKVFGDVPGPPGLVARIKQASEVAEVLGAVLRSHPRDYYPAVVEDVDDVFRLMREADRGAHWKRAWWRIRILRALKRLLARMCRCGRRRGAP